MRLLVTGGGGFVGRFCLPRLAERGWTVVATTRTRARDPVAGIEWRGCNLLEPAELEPLVADVLPTHLLHLAWVTEPASYLESRENDLWLRASIALVDAFLAHGGRRVVAAGTCLEYEPETDLCREDATPLRPRSRYGVSKNELRIRLQAACERSGASWAWGRIFHAYGPGEPVARLIPSVIGSLSRGQAALCTEGSQERDFVFVADVAEAFVTLLERAFVGPVNIATGVATRVRDVAREIGRLLGREDLVRIGARASRPDDPEAIVADVSRLHRDVGFRAQTGLSEGLARTLEWHARRPAARAAQASPCRPATPRRDSPPKGTE